MRKPEVLAAMLAVPRHLFVPLSFRSAGDGYKGWPEAASFDPIMLTSAPPQVPQAPIGQLSQAEYWSREWGTLHRIKTSSSSTKIPPEEPNSAP